MDSPPQTLPGSQQRSEQWKNLTVALGVCLGAASDLLHSPGTSQARPGANGTAVHGPAGKREGGEVLRDGPCTLE